MNTKEIREVLRNELECVKRQMGTMCANGRDCINCDLALPDDVVISAYESVLSLINRQKAEIERLTSEITARDNSNYYNVAQLRIAREKIKKLKQENIILSQDADTAFQDGLNEAQDLYAEQVKVEVKSEAIKEFAVKLKELKIKPEYPWDDYYINENAIDNLVKQMTEVHK